MLFDELGLTKKRRGKTGFSTDARVLAQIRDEHEIVAKVESWRELTKLKNTYLDSLPELIARDGPHPHDLQPGARRPRGGSRAPTRTSRTSRSAPRSGGRCAPCFVAEPGMRLLSCDYNQVELRVLAHVADEDVLREIFASGEDVHAETAAEVLDIDPDAVGPAERSKAKMVNYGIAYGLSASGSPTASRSPARRPAPTSTATSSASPRSSGSSTRRSSAPSEEGYVTTLMGRRRRIPELALASASDACSASGSRSTP